MEVIIHDASSKIVEFCSEKTILNIAQDALDLMIKAAEQDSGKIILHENNIHPDFFKLSSGFAGEILQKLVNYHVKLAIAGDFSKYESNNFKSFIAECNRGNQFFFVSNIDEALERLKKV
jgi:hypothetical protein